MYPEVAPAKPQRWLLVILLAVALLGVVQLEASHVHSFDSGIECEFCAAAPPLDPIVNQSIDWADFFALLAAMLTAKTIFSSAHFPRYQSRAPPAFS